jgi:uncharacterized protein YbjQ (UPF0145 family)
MNREYVVTSSIVPGMCITRSLGIVRGNSMRARHVGKDIMAGLRMMVGGDVHEYAHLLAESREQALDRMIEQAEEIGATAVVDVRFGTSFVQSGAAEMLAYGTAVLAEAEN